MSHPSYFLGIDLGSSSVKTSLFDSDKGDTIDSITYPEKEMKIVSKKKDGQSKILTIGGNVSKNVLLP